MHHAQALAISGRKKKMENLINATHKHSFTYPWQRRAEPMHWAMPIIELDLYVFTWTIPPIQWRKRFFSSSSFSAGCIMRKWFPCTCTPLHCSCSWVAIVRFSHGNMWWWCHWRRYSTVDALFSLLLINFNRFVRNWATTQRYIQYQFHASSTLQLLWISLARSPFFPFHSHAYHLLLLL